MKKLWLSTLLCMGLGAPVSVNAGNPILQADVYFQKGQVYLRVQNYTKAIEVFTLAIQFNPRHDRAYHQRGSAWYYLKEYEKACQDWRKACELNHACMGWNFGKYQKLCAVSASEAEPIPSSETPESPAPSAPELPTTLE